MKQLLLVVIFTFQTIFPAVAFSWSTPFDSESVFDYQALCKTQIFAIQETDSGAGEDSEEEDEEPDCE